MSRKPDAIGLGYAIKGMKAAFATENNLRVEAVIGALVMIFGLIFRVSLPELAILALAVGLVIGAELVNSAIELLVDYIGTERNEVAGRIKDISAAAVLASAAASMVIGLCIFVPKILLLFQAQK